MLVLQGNVATKLSYGGKFFILVMSHFFLIPTVKEFKKSTNICQSYSKNESGTVFSDSQCCNKVNQRNDAGCRRRQMDLTDAEQELREMSTAAADVCDTYCSSRRVQRCDTGPTKYTVTADDDSQRGCVHHFTAPSVDSCSPGTPLTLKSSTGGVLGPPNSLAATLTARYLDQ